MIRLLVVGDLHGEMPEIHREDFDILISPGDVCGDKIRPYLKSYMKMRTRMGPLAPDFEEICDVKTQKKLEKESLKEGRAVLERLNSFGKPVILVPGNWDPQERQDGKEKEEGEDEKWQKLLSNLEHVHDVQHTSFFLQGLTFIGHGSTSAPEPRVQIPKEIFDDEEEFQDYNKRYTYYEKVYQKLSKLFQKNKTPTIFLTHNVPYKTKLDKVISPGTYADKQHYGSRIAREIVDELQPLLCIGGHIHEGHGKLKIGNTLCINAGFGGDVNTIVEIDEKKGKIINVEFLGKNKTHH